MSCALWKRKMLLNLLSRGKNRQTLSLPIVFAYGFHLTIYCTILLLKERANLYLVASNTILIAVLMATVLQTYIHREKRQSKNMESKTCQIVYIVCTTHIIFQIVFGGKNFTLDRGFLASLRLFLPLGFGLLWNVSFPLVMICQTFISLATSIAYQSSGQSVEVTLSVWSEFLLILCTHLCWIQLHGKRGKAVHHSNDAPKDELGIQKASYIAQVAHDIGTPLTIFSLTVESLHLTDLSEEQMEMVESLESTIDLMTVMRLEALDVECKVYGHDPVPSLGPVSMWEVLKKCRRVMRNYAGAADVSLEFFLSPSVSSKVELDFDWTWAMLVQLLSNAKKFTVNGSVQVTVYVISRDLRAQAGSRERTISGIEEQQAKKCLEKVLRIEVADTGIGVAPDKQADLFKPFNQLSDKGGGVGIGLHSVQTKCRILGGQAGMRNNTFAGKGSIFWIELPYKALASTPAGAPAPAGAPPKPVMRHLTVFGAARHVLSKRFRSHLESLFASTLWPPGSNFLKEKHDQKSSVAIRVVRCPTFHPASPDVPKALSPSSMKRDSNYTRSPSRKTLLQVFSAESPTVGPGKLSVAQKQLHWCQDEMEVLREFPGAGLGLLVIYIDEETPMLDVRDVNLIRSQALNKHWNLVYGRGNQLELDVLAAIHRHACLCGHESPRPRLRNSIERLPRSSSSKRVPTLHLEKFSLLQPRSQRYLTSENTLRSGRQVMTPNSTESKENGMTSSSKTQRRLSSSCSHGLIKTIDPLKRSTTGPLPRNSFCTQRSMDSMQTHRESIEDENKYSDEGFSERKSNIGDPPNTGQVLIVSDDKPVAKLLSHMFMKTHFSVFVAFDAEEGCAMLQERIYTGVIVTDAGQLDGLEFISRLGKMEFSQHYNLNQIYQQNFVLLASQFTTSYEKRAKQAGISTVLSKPFKFSQLLAAVEKTCSTFSMREKSFSCFSTKSADSNRFTSTYSRLFGSRPKFQRKEQRSSFVDMHSSGMHSSGRSGASSPPRIQDGHPKRLKYGISSLLSPRQQTQVQKLSVSIETPIRSRGRSKSCSMSFSSEQKSLLVVDDENTITKYLSRMLTKKGFNVSICKDGLEGLCMLKSKQFEVVFLDRNMPVMDGITALQRFRSWEMEQISLGTRTQRQYITMLSANAALSDQEVAYNCNADWFISKPCKMKEILEIIEKKPQKKRTGAPAVTTLDATFSDRTFSEI